MKINCISKTLVKLLKNRGYLGQGGLYEAVSKEIEHLKKEKLIIRLSVSCLSWMQLFNVINLADGKHPAMLVVDTICSHSHTEMHSLNIQSNKRERIN